VTKQGLENKKSHTKRVVVKIGSSSLTDNGALSNDKIAFHAKALAKARQKGIEVVLVSSGAVAAGATELLLTLPLQNLQDRQASACVGQTLLMQKYREEFAKYSIAVGQLLLTRKDFAHRVSYSNLVKTLETLLEFSLIPIINENDAVKHSDNSLGDNDMLASLLACSIHANLLIVLTDVDGVYAEDPRKNPSAKRLSKIDSITDGILKGASGEGSKFSTGGMISKLKALQQSLKLGVPGFIGCFSSENYVEDILQGSGSGSYIGTSDVPLIGRKLQWVAFSSEIKGIIYIDEGAEKALLEEGKSLLPVGVASYTGVFLKDDVIEVRNLSGKILGRGISQYDSTLLSQTIGKSTEYGKQIGAKKPELIHRNDWVELGL
jgi:glutamate 5-kinase